MLCLRFLLELKRNQTLTSRCSHSLGCFPQITPEKICWSWILCPSVRACKSMLSRFQQGCSVSKPQSTSPHPIRKFLPLPVFDCTTLRLYPQVEMHCHSRKIINLDEANLPSVAKMSTKRRVPKSYLKHLFTTSPRFPFSKSKQRRHALMHLL